MKAAVDTADIRTALVSSLLHRTGQQLELGELDARMHRDYRDPRYLGFCASACAKAREALELAERLHAKSQAAV